MERLKSKCGYVYYKINFDEIFMLGGMGICDSCNKASFDYLYLIPVLNRAYCDSCFNSWNSRAIYYRENIWFEAENIKFYESVIGGSNEKES